ncbi:MAG: LPS export ABC transporter permease LptG [Desulfobacterales bacterium]
MDQIKVIDRHLGRSTLMGCLLVLSVLLVLFSLIEMLVQLNDVGKGAFRVTDAIIHVGLTLPKRAADLMPLAALLGSILSLGLLADHQELTAMHAAGMSVQRIAMSVLATSILIMLTVFIIAEFVAPPLDQEARFRRSKAIYGRDVVMTKSGFWTRYGSMLIHVGRVQADGLADNIEVYRLDETGQLRQFIYAAQANIEEGRDWRLQNAHSKTFGEEEVKVETLSEYRLPAFLSSGQVAVLQLPPDSLSISELWNYIRTLRERAQNAQSYALAFWQKILLPFTTGAMVLLSLSFVFGSTRMHSAGQRIFAGMLTAVAFQLSNQLLGHVGLLLNVPPLLTTLLPVALILALALQLLRRSG